MALHHGPAAFVFCAIAAAGSLASLPACSGGGGGSDGPSAPGGSATVTASPGAGTPSTAAPVAAATPPLANPAFVVPAGFTMTQIASVSGARELAMLPNGDLLVGTSGSGVDIVPNADGDGVAGTPATFAQLGENAPEGVAYANGFVYAATQHTLWRTAYTSGDQKARGFSGIASFRQGNPTPNSDGDVHTSSSVAATASQVYIGIGSGCNACTEVDPTRATIQMTAPDGSGMVRRATRIRNAIALAIDGSGHLWAGGAGQDNLPSTHPYEYFDDVSSHDGTADYGWPACEEDHVAYTPGSACANTVQPLAELPAYSTLIGATFYPANPTGPYAFPSAYRGGAFVTAHGSWHVVNGHHIPPRVAFIPMSGTTPATAVDWSDPTAQWSEFVGGWQDNTNNDNRIGRPTGIAVGPGGSLFVADDQNGVIYRIRPATVAGSSAHRR